MKEQKWKPRLATERDIPAIQSLLESSARMLQSDVYTAAQIESAIGPVYAVDRQLIKDETYYVVEYQSQLVGCGGWSRRKTLYGADQGEESTAQFLDPTQHAAKVRAFFVHPHWARKGIGAAILQICESQIQVRGFLSAEMVATLSGVPLYTAFGYSPVEQFTIPLPTDLELAVVLMRKSLGIVCEELK